MWSREQCRLFAGIYLTYAAYYITRKSVSALAPSLVADDALHITPIELGWMASGMGLCYSTGKLVFGVAADLYPPYIVLAVPLLVASLCNALLVATSPSRLWWFVLWALNGFVQGSGWGPCVRLFKIWWPAESRGRAYAIGSTSQSVGATLCAILCTRICERHGWDVALYAVSGIGCSMALLGGYLTSESVQNAPAYSQRSSHGEGNNDDDATKEEATLSKEISIGVANRLSLVFGNSNVWWLCVAFFSLYVVRSGLSDWVALFFVRDKGMTPSNAGGCVAMLEIGGAVGSFAAGVASDVYFQGRRGPVSVLGAAVLLALLLPLAVVQGVALNSLIMLLIGAAMYAPQMLIGLQIIEVVDSRVAGTAQGVAGMIAGLGSVSAGAPIGMLLERVGPENAWWAFLLALGSAAAVTLTCVVPVWGVGTKARKVE